MANYTIPVLPPIRKTEEEWQDYQEPIESGQLGIVSDKNAVFVGNGADRYSDKRIMRPINPIDNLDSDSATEALSANQGRRLAKEHLIYKIWVNSETGSDITGDGTSTKPYETLQYVLDTAPKSGDLTIYLMSGDPDNDEYAYEITKPIDIYNDYFSIVGVKANVNYELPVINIDYQQNIKDAGYVFNCCSKRQCEFNKVKIDMHGNNYINTTDYLKNTYLILTDYCSSGIIVDNCIISTGANIFYISGGKAKITNTTFADYSLLAYEYYSDLVFSGNTYISGDAGFYCVGGHIYFRDELNLAAPGGNNVSEDAQIIGTSGKYYVDANSGAADGVGIGSEGVPFKKIEYAIKALPTNCTGTYTIAIANGSYNENPLDLSGKCLGGTISIEGTNKNNTKIQVNAIEIDTTEYADVNGNFGFLCYAKNKGSVNISMKNFYVESANGQANRLIAGIYCCGTSNTYINNVSVVQCVTCILLKDIIGAASIESCYCSNYTTYGVNFNNCPFGKSIGTTGSSNQTLVRNDSSLVLFDKINNTTPSSTYRPGCDNKSLSIRINNNATNVTRW